MIPRKLEIACFSIAAAELVISVGCADRVELCAHPGVGGITPQEIFLDNNQDRLRVLSKKSALRIMIRPRGGDFNYSAAEFTLMEVEIMQTLKLVREGTLINPGFVFGILTPTGAVDVPRCSSLVRMAAGSGMKCTFHRAFDEVEEKATALEDVINCGFDALLTSGGVGMAMANLHTLSKLVEQANGRIQIIAGGGVRADCLPDLVGVGATWVHSSAIRSGELPDLNELAMLKMRLDT